MVVHDLSVTAGYKSQKPRIDPPCLLTCWSSLAFFHFWWCAQRMNISGGKTMNRVSSVAFRAAVAAIILCFGVSRLQAQASAPASPAPDAQDSRMSAPAVSAAAQTAKSSAPKQAPLLLELPETVTTKSARPGAEAHFRVVEDFIEDGLIVIAK